MENEQHKSTDTISSALYQKELLAACKQKSISFRKFFNALVIFSLTFGFFIAWPYLSTLQSAELQQVQLKQQKSELLRLKELQKKYEAPRNGMKELSALIKGGASMLRAYIISLQTGRPFGYPKISDTCLKFTDTPMAQGFATQQLVVPNMAQMIQAQIPTPNQEMQPRDKCLSGSQEQQMICRVDRFIQYQLCEYEQRFDKDVLQPLSRLSDKDHQLFDESELAGEFQKMRETLRAHIQQKPRFWVTIQGKGAMSITLDKEIKNLWQGLRSKIQPVMHKLNTRIDNGKKKIMQLRQDQENLIKRQKQLSARITEIESPIGKLPIGLAESVLVFPIILAFGFWFTTGIFIEHIGLRVDLKEIEANGDLAKESLSSRQIARLAPLWIDPENNNQTHSARVFGILIPVIAFVFAVAAIIYNELTLTSTLFSQIGISETVYWALYGISAVSFLCALLQIRRSLSRLESK